MGAVDAGLEYDEKDFFPSNRLARAKTRPPERAKGQT